MARKIGYARSAVASDEIENQIAALKAAGCSQVFSDNGISGLKASRSGLEQAIESLSSGDSLVVVDVARLSRSVSDIVGLHARLREREVMLETLANPSQAASFNR